MDADSALVLGDLVRVVACGAVVSGRGVVGHLVASDDGVDNPFKTLLGVDHFDQQLSFEKFVVLLDVELELLVASADLRNDIVTLHLHVDLVDTHEVQSALDPDDWDRDSHLVDHALQFKVNLYTFSWNK